MTGVCTRENALHIFEKDMGTLPKSCGRWFQDVSGVAADFQLVMFQKNIHN